MKNLLLSCTLFFILSSCSDDDSQTENIDTQLLVGQWQNTEACPDSEDSISFTSNNTFVLESSDNTSVCNTTAVCGSRLSGGYHVDGNYLSYTNVVLESVEYTNETICVSDMDASVEERFEITELTESLLKISNFASDNGGELQFRGSISYMRQ